MAASRMRGSSSFSPRGWERPCAARDRQDVNPIVVRAIDHVVLRVADLERAKKFYVEVLGCPVEKWQAELGLLQLRAGSALIDLVPLDGPLGRAGGAALGRDGHNLD